MFREWSEWVHVRQAVRKKAMPVLGGRQAMRKKQVCEWSKWVLIIILLVSVLLS